MMLLVDVFFRFTGIGLLLLIAFLSLRDNRSWKSTPYLVLSCISVLALFLGYTLEELKPPLLLYHLARLIDAPHLIFVWLFVLSLYQRDFQLKYIHFIIGLLYTLPILRIRLTGFGILDPYASWLIPYVSITSILLILFLIFILLKEWSDDLLEIRRKSRMYFVAAVVLGTIITAILEPLLMEIGGFENQTLKIVFIWPAIVFGATWLLKANNTTVHFHQRIVNHPEISSRDIDLKKKLEHLLLENELYRDNELNIVKLSNRLGVTQHRLRELINKTMKHQNFSSFINAIRVNNIKKQLIDKNKSHIPIQTFALQHGFKSLSAFNRAFRINVGMTPSEFRKNN